MVNRRGTSSLGCLVPLLLIAATLYFGLPIAESYWRYYRFQDEMKQAARFARIHTDDMIRQRLAAFADSLGLPPEASRVGIRRVGQNIVIGAEYSQEFQLPGTVRRHVFTPMIETPY